jgi:hypothetical protein
MKNFLLKAGGVHPAQKGRLFRVNKRPWFKSIR